MTPRDEVREALAEVIHDTLVSCEVAFGWTADCAGGKGHEKPNGRMAWSITLSGVDGPRYIDLSVAPIVATPTASAPQVTEAMVEAATALVAKLDAVHADPKYGAVWAIAQAHYGQYDGPKYEDELNTLRAALAARTP